MEPLRSTSTAGGLSPSYAAGSVLSRLFRQRESVLRGVIICCGLSLAANVLLAALLVLTRADGALLVLILAFAPIVNIALVMKSVFLNEWKAELVFLALISSLTYAMLALAVDLVWGYCGILSLGHAAFFALGGYAMGMYLMRQIGPRGVYGDPVLPGAPAYDPRAQAARGLLQATTRLLSRFKASMPRAKM